MQTLRTSAPLPQRWPTAQHEGAAALWSALLTGLDRCAHGVALLDADGHPWFANASAHLVFDRLGLAGSATAPSAQAQAWIASLRKVCDRGRREMVELVLPRCTVSVALMPVPMPGARLAFALFGPEEICGAVELQQFALRHGLTPAETQVLGLLCKGLAAAEIARVHGVARNTVLSQIAAIRSKTRSTSVRSLMAEIARMPQFVPALSVIPHEVHFRPVPVARLADGTFSRERTVAARQALSQMAWPVST